jgi:hypothetical protein
MEMYFIYNLISVQQKTLDILTRPVTKDLAVSCICQYVYQYPD